MKPPLKYTDRQRATLEAPPKSEKGLLFWYELKQVRWLLVVSIALAATILLNFITT